MDTPLTERLLDRALDDEGRLVVDTSASRDLQAADIARLTPEQLARHIEMLFRVAPPDPDAPRRPPSSSWLELRERLIREQRLLERPPL